MQQNLRFDNPRVNFDDSVLPFTLATNPDTSRSWRLPVAVAHAIAGPLCGIADIACMASALIYLALRAGGARFAADYLSFLSVRISVGHVCVLVVCAVFWRMIFSYCGLYTWKHVQSAREVPGRVVLATVLAALVAGQAISIVWHHGHVMRETVLFWLIATAGTLLVRIVLGLFSLYLRPHLRQPKDAVIVGGPSRAFRIAQELKSHPEWNYKILGRVDSSASPSPEGGAGWIGRIGDLEDILMKQVVDEVVIALSAKSQYAAIERVISICERVGVQVQYCDELFFDESRRSRCYRERYDDRKVILKMVENDYRHRIKRAVDIVGALAGLVLCGPLFLIVAILIKCTSRGPVFFRQQRYGLGKRIFWMYKFRTMVDNAEASQAALEHLNENSGPVFKIFKDPRVTKVGAFLRKTSIDELPQFINILKGEMSFVGPRPLNLRDVSRFSEAWLMRRFSVKPGLTCLWQIGGRSNVSFDRWIELDLRYIDNWSLKLDLQILARTVPVVLRGTGAA